MIGEIAEVLFKFSWWMFLGGILGLCLSVLVSWFVKG